MALGTGSSPPAGTPAPAGPPPERGLTEREAQERLKRHGPNRTEVPRAVRFGAIFLEEIREPMILLLLAVAAAYSVFGEVGEALTVLAIIAGIVLVEVWTEYRAKRAVAALAALSAPVATVIRDGAARQIPAEQVVPGDILVLRAGMRIAADGILLEASDLAADESALTGESVPVEKAAADPVFRGTAVVRGEGVARVAATGLETELGRITGLTRAARPPRTPLQKMMKALSRTLAAVALAFAVLIPLLLRRTSALPWPQAVLTGLSLAFATIPEELPILVTMVLGLGSLRLARERALVRRLQAAETLGHVTAIVTDKTGTLTENRLRLVTVEPVAAGGEQLLARAALRSVGIDPSRGPGPGKELSDPIDRAIWEAFGPGAAAAPGSDGAAGSLGMLVRRLPFHPERGWSGAVWRTEEAEYQAVKGAPEAVLALAGPDPGPDPGTLRRRVDALAGAGHRVLAVAENGRVLGLLAFADPLRPEAAAAVRAVRRAGVRVVMATGDHPAVARAIAGQIGLDTGRVLTGADLDRLDPAGWDEAVRTVSVFARITPEHKLRIVETLERRGEVVAMTGDGVNDAPALRAADIGVAMGQGGTDVAREAAGLVVTDDRFATLVTAIREGRTLFANLQKAVRYYLAVKVALIAAMLVPAALGWAPPFPPILIVLLELFMDLAASTAFVIEKPEGELMEEPPRDPKRALLDPLMVRGILTGGLLLAAAVLTAAEGAARRAGGDAASTASVRVSAAFVTWMLGHVILAFAMRTLRLPPWRAGLFGNPVMSLWAAGVLATGLAVTTLPALRRTFGTAPLPPAGWAWTLGALAGLVAALGVIGPAALWRPGPQAQANPQR
ncbi:cation-translocating P-type ATPase [Caldinitratiruptor microaerophilus]|uniref:Cation transport ATPase n=1 Tax=Caldinitratiruptor microaerophilus TaxID=671077 RepID=A0AA35CNY8_9FIRM|nr:cation-transporting P-type ATPase [Caldinitratiruptor microaerophilus]BDG60880.1 cation transport ATPase [Caldinitratiruptor microaerophilus]